MSEKIYIGIWVVYFTIVIAYVRLVERKKIKIKHKS